MRVMRIDTASVQVYACVFAVQVQHRCSDFCNAITHIYPQSVTQKHNHTYTPSLSLPAAGLQYR